MNVIRVGTRGSKLARMQTESVVQRLRERFPNLEFETHIITTPGDRVQDKPLSEIGGSGLFTSELERALIDKEIDFAVHSMKDLPARIDSRLCLAPCPMRADPADVLVMNDGITSPDMLPQGARIGTGSPRRAVQLAAIRPDFEVVPIRGNVDTRLGKVGDGLDAVVLAAAGLERAGYESRISYRFSPDEMIPAPGQGILALECRADDTDMLSILGALEDTDTQLAACAERAFLLTTGAGCHAPVGAYCRTENGQICLTALYGEEGRDVFVADSICGKAEDAEMLGIQLATQLKKMYEEKYCR